MQSKHPTLYLKSHRRSESQYKLKPTPTETPSSNTRRSIGSDRETTTKGSFKAFKSRKNSESKKTTKNSHTVSNETFKILKNKAKEDKKVTGKSDVNQNILKIMSGMKSLKVSSKKPQGTTPDLKSSLKNSRKESYELRKMLVYSEQMFDELFDSLQSKNTKEFTKKAIEIKQYLRKANQDFRIYNNYSQEDLYYNELQVKGRTSANLKFKSKINTPELSSPKTSLHRSKKPNGRTQSTTSILKPGGIDFSAPIDIQLQALKLKTENVLSSLSKNKH